MLHKKYIFSSGRRKFLCGIYIIAGIILVSSCRKNLYNHPLLDDKFVVLAEITAGDSANIPIGKTLPAGSGNSVIFKKINSVAASITAQDGSIQQLSLNTSQDFISNPMAVYSGPGNFLYNTEYTLTATDPLLGTISATTNIPNDFSVSHVETEHDEFNGKQVLRFKFVIDDAGNEKNFYFFEAVKQLVMLSRYFYWQGTKYDYDTQSGYDLFQQVGNNPGVNLLLDTMLTHQFIRLNVFTRDNRTENFKMSSLDSSFRRIFVSDSTFNGREFETEIFIARDQFIAANPQQLGVVQVQVKSVSKELYDYLSQYEKYTLDFGNFPVNNLSSPVGNIKNGLGVFGGSCRKQWSFYYDMLK